MNNLPQTRKKSIEDLKQAFCQGVTILPCSITILIPSTINIFKMIDNKKQVNKTVEFFTRFFTGAFSNPPKSGYWRAKNGKLVKEKVIEVCSFMDEETFKSCFGLIMSYAMSLKTEMAQESLALIINGEMVLI